MDGVKDHEDRLVRLVLIFMSRNAWGLIIPMYAHVSHSKSIWSIRSTSPTVCISCHEIHRVVSHTRFTTWGMPMSNASAKNKFECSPTWKITSLITHMTCLEGIDTISPLHKYESRWYTEATWGKAKGEEDLLCLPGDEGTSRAVWDTIVVSLIWSNVLISLNLCRKLETSVSLCTALTQRSANNW